MPIRDWPKRCFRPARTRPMWVNAVCTLLQTAGMWGTFLVAIPAAIVWLQRRMEIPFFEPGEWATAAVWAFWAAGLTGIYCGFLFVRHGAGTPLPLDETTRLVVLGPYRYVRNPMAILGIGQGVLVGVWLGSWPVMLYAACGTLAWHALARPFEERDLLHRHGEEYARYRDAVRNWVPRLRPYPRVGRET